METKKLILASGSPRRREILEMAGYIFTVITPDAEEVKEGHSPEDLATENSRLKAVAAVKTTDGIIICADTVVALGDEILGKPENAERAKEMLRALSGKTHAVITGYTVTDGEKFISGHIKTHVTMRCIHEDEIESYVATATPLDKAGAYGIQEAAGMFVSGISGDYYNVVGLPLSKISEILREEFSVRAFMK